MNDLNQPTRYFRGLQQGAFMRLEHAASLKGLLKPFKGKGDFEAWASQCFAMRDELIALAQRQVLEQACGHPFHLLPIELAQQTTGAGTVFLRWRRHDRSAMGVALWFGQDLLTPYIHGTWPVRFAALAALVSAGMVVYGLATVVMGAFSKDDIALLLRRRRATS